MDLSRDRLTWRELLRTDRTFVALVSALVLAACVGLVLLPRVWRVTPPGFYPVERVNGVALMNERLAIRAARAAEATGDATRALEQWARAVAANPAATESKRRYLQLCIERGGILTDPEGRRQQVREASLLLRLGGTNQADVELTAAFAHALEQDDYTVKSLGRQPVSSLTPVGRVTLASAYFQMDDFPAVLKVAQASPGETNTLFQLQRTAAAMIVAGSAGAADWSRLESADETGPAGRVAASVRLVVAAYLADEARFNQAWALLERAHALRARDHARRWQIAARLGRLADAANSAFAFDERPLSAQEALQVVRGLDRIGMTAKAIRYGEGALERHRSDPALWREVGRLMVRESAPEILIRFAASLRRVEWDDEPQLGLASFYIGVAEHRLGHATRADASFGEASTDPYLRQVPLLALECADTMRRLGYADRAERLAQGVVADHSAEPDFWPRVLHAARDARSETWVLDVSRREHQANPGVLHVQQWYLDALLLNRTNATEALTLATRLHQAQPTDPFRTVALARALALQGRWADVAKTLAPMDEASLRGVDPDIVSRLHLARGEALVELDRRREAAEQLARVDTTRLFPDESARCQLLRERAR